MRDWRTRRRRHAQSTRREVAHALTMRGRRKGWTGRARGQNAEREREAGQRERHALALRPRGTGLGDGAEWPLSENGCLAWGIRSEGVCAHMLLDTHAPVLRRTRARERSTLRARRGMRAKKGGGPVGRHPAWPTDRRFGCGMFYAPVLHLLCIPPHHLHHTDPEQRRLLPSRRSLCWQSSAIASH